MTYLALALIAAALLALVCLLARDVLRCLERADLLYEAAAAGECHCSRHRLCAVCLAELRGDREAA